MSSFISETFRFEEQNILAGGDFGALRAEDLGDDAGLRGGDGDLPLHGFDNGDALASGDWLARLAADIPHAAVRGRLHGSVSGGDRDFGNGRLLGGRFDLAIEAGF